MSHTIDPAELAELLEFARAIAREAGRIAGEAFGARLAAERKPDDTLVTETDRRAESLLRERLAARCPRDGVIGEEHGAIEGETGRRWTVDPIDGTRSFVHGVPLYGVLIGLLAGDEAVLGVVHLPSLDETVAAARGCGCVWTSGGESRPARVSNETDPRSSLFLTTAIPAPDHEHTPAFGRLARTAGTFRTWGDCWGHVLVATGRAEAMVDPVMHVWDSVPLQPIVQEAGGRFTTTGGRAVPDGGSAVSTNGHLHDAVLAAFAAA